VVSVNVRNRDLESVVNDIHAILDEHMELPSGYSIDYGGQFENLQNASRRLKLAVPIALLLIFIFLHFAFSSIKEAALIFTAVPLSVVGGVFLLWIRGMPFSISAGIGFIALFGVAVLNGIVLIEHLNGLKKQGITDMRQRVLQGTRERLRPVLLTASAAALGFLPMAISTSAGAEVQRPLATVVIGGLVTSTLLTMLALPLLYSIVDGIKGIRLWPPKIIREKSGLILLLLLLPGLAYAQSMEGAPRGTRELSLTEAIEIAYRNNRELQSYSLRAEESRELIRTAFTIDKTSLYYNYDENNVAGNDYPIGVIGGEQRFDFPSLYFAQKDANSFAYDMSVDQMEMKKREITREVSKAYFRIMYLQGRADLYMTIDSIYDKYSRASDMSFEQGEISYLEQLNARSVRHRIQLNLNQLKHDIHMAKTSLGTLLHSDTLYAIPGDTIPLLVAAPDSVSTLPEFQYLQNEALKQNAELRVERQRLLPDLTLGYFNGTNRFEGARHYQGFEVGVGIPLFFSEQRARIKAKGYAMEANQSMQEFYTRRYRQRVEELMTQLEKYGEELAYYLEYGKVLSKELSRSALLGYQEGEIDFYRFVLSIDQAIQMELTHLESLFLYNQTVLEINYLTLE
jgi:cobalt-zinc-cadmium resistance protein CzcA